MKSLILVILLLLFFWTGAGQETMRAYNHSRFNTQSVQHCEADRCRSYRVHSEYDGQEAAALLAEITKRNAQFLEHLRRKYTPGLQFNKDKSGTLDVVPVSAAGQLDVNGKPPKMELDPEYVQARVEQLLDRYDREHISEISPLNIEGNTSYAEDKRRLVLCLRNKSDQQLHDINIMMFVVVHELTHVANDRWGHDAASGFWPLFRFFLGEALEAGVYEPVNYAREPTMYCGMHISYNPLY